VLSSSNFDLSARYPLSAFTRAQPIQAAWKAGGAPLGSRSPTVPRVPGNVARLKSLDDLPDAVTFKTKILITQGKDPEELGPVDRSRVVLRVCCDLVRAGVDDATIYSIITDEAYEISASVRDKGSSKERYALRQIERAKEFSISPHLLRFNERFAIIENYGGRCRVIEEQSDPAFGGRSILTFQSFDDFKNRWMHMKVPCGFDKNGKPVEIPLGKWWLDQAARRQYTSIAFSPGRELEGVYNLWRGFAVEPRPGDKHQRFLDHVRSDLCNSDDRTYEYLLGWMARAVQIPNASGEVAIVLRGRKGTGKCLGLGTKVLKYDGTRVNVEDIRVGDLLMGPDSRPRRVLGATRGNGQLYRVVPVKGEPWICNDAHVLTLTSWSTGELLDVPVEDFMQSGVKFRQTHFQTFVGVDFPPLPAPLPIDPYFFGLWLGDGNKDLASVAITTMDSEIVDACNTEARRWGLHVTKVIKKDNLAARYLLAIKRGGQKKNPLLDAMRIAVGPDKSIPANYLRASREERLALLAGFIDTDGSLSCGGFEIIQKRRDYVDALIFLCRSLGLQATVNEKIVTGKLYWRVFVSGDCSVIPTRLPHKRAPVRQHVKDVTRTGITIEDAGVGEYAGFEVEGDGRFLLGDFTITHNSTFAKMFGALFGRHYWQVSDARHIVGNFNAHLRDCVVLFGDEAFWAGDKKHEGVLKALITEDTFVVERKGFDAEAAPNYVHLIMASNAQWVVPASHDERRFLVLDVAPTHIQDKTYFGAIDADMKSGGLSNLLHALLTRDITAFDHRTVPQTAALQDQKIHSLESHEEFWFRRLCDANLRPLHAGWTAPVQKNVLVDDYLTYAQRLGSGKRASATSFIRSIERWCPGIETFQAKLSGRDANGDPQIGNDIFWKFPELSICRETFEKQCGGPFDWLEIEVRERPATKTTPF
jgi:hypothetical protein